MELGYRAIDAVNRRDLDALLELMMRTSNPFRESSRWRAASTATMASVDGGKAGSMHFPTTEWRWSRYATAETS